MAGGSVEPLLTIAYLVWLTLFGAVFGSFANVVVWRFPRGESVVSPGSRCPVCGHAVRWYDNVPVISWMILRARCRDCGSPISVRYPIVEALSALLWLSAGLRFGITWRAVACIVFFYGLLVLSFIDLDTLRLPNALVATLAALGLVGAVASQLAGSDAVPLVGLAREGLWSSPLVVAAIGAASGAGVSGLIAAVYAVARGRTGLGMGDVKLLAAIGLFTGPYVLAGLVLGSFAGAIVGVVAAARAGEEASSFRIPFGPFLAAGSVVAVLAGPQLWQSYLRMLGSG
jgi:leader peptidase (prepilin peptidase)/N-methyltransferase